MIPYFWQLAINPKFNNFLWVCWFLCKVFLILYPPLESSTICIALLSAKACRFFRWWNRCYFLCFVCPRNCSMLPSFDLQFSWNWIFWEVRKWCYCQPFQQGYQHWLCQIWICQCCQLGKQWKSVQKCELRYSCPLSGEQIQHIVKIQANSLTNSQHT